MSSRFTPLELPRWSECDEFRALVSAFEQVLPLRRSSDLQQRPFVQLLIVASGGLLGEVSRILNAAAEHAIADDSERITLRHLEHACHAQFERAWPVCPRPFADETFGSWFGRVAARYRMDVDHLAESTGVELEIGRDCFGWLTMPSPRGRTLQRLAALARVEPITLANLASGGPVAAAGPTIWFCCRCFFLNPLEVESPYWHAAWLAMEPAYCPVHNVAPRAAAAWRPRQGAQHREAVRLRRQPPHDAL